MDRKGGKDAALRPLKYVLAVALAAPLFGFDLGSVFANRNELMYLYMLDSYDIDSVVSVFVLGTLSGIFLGGFVIAGSGRKSGIVAGIAVGAAASCSALLAPEFSTLLLSEFAAGGGFGMYLVSALIYAAEIALPQSRGFCCALPAVFLALGLALTVTLRGALSENNALLASGGGIIGLALCVICGLRLPESPRWLAVSGYYDAALTALISLRRDSAAAARELAFINDCARGRERSLQLFLHSSPYRSVLWFLVAVTALLHLAGFSLIPYMSLELVHRYQLQYLGQVVMRNYDYSYGFVKAAVTVGLFGAIASMLVSDRIGRARAVFTGSAFAFAVLLLLSAVTFFEIDGFSALIIGALILIFICAASFTLTTFLSCYACELIPSCGREFGMSLVLFVNFIAFMAGIQDVGIMTPGFRLTPFFAALVAFDGALLYFLWRLAPDPGLSSLEKTETRLFEGQLGRGLKGAWRR